MLYQCIITDKNVWTFGFTKTAKRIRVRAVNGDVTNYEALREALHQLALQEGISRVIVDESLLPASLREEHQHEAS